MSDTSVPRTELTSQYAARVTADLERNAREQERLRAEITALQEHLLAVRQDHAVLVNIRRALGTAAAAAGPGTGPRPTAAAAPSVPRQKSGSPSGGRERAAGKKAVAGAEAAPASSPAPREEDGAGARPEPGAA